MTDQIPEVPLDLGPIDTGALQEWMPGHRERYFQAYTRAQEIAEQTRRAFYRKVDEAWSRYHSDPMFHARAHVMLRVLEDSRPGNGPAEMAIRVLVAVEEMDGGVLDLRIADG